MVDAGSHSKRTLEMSPDEFRALGYQAIDLIADALDQRQQRLEPARRAVPEELRNQLHHQPLPIDGEAPEVLLDFVAEQIFPYPLGHNNPRFFAWVNPPAAPISVIGELLAAGMNSSAAGGDQASTYLEHGVLNWFKELLGFPQESGALLVSGGSMASIVGLAVMRHVQSKGLARTEGLHQQDAPMIIYTSTEGHSCLQKAVELLGFGHNNLRKIPVDSERRMRVDVLAAQITADRVAGLRPVCVAGSAGTVNTGAIDPLDAIADLCEREGLWFHVDGAFGGIAKISPLVAPLYQGLSRADSLAIDPHKWMYIPVECGCAIVRDRQAMQNTFSLVPEYLRDDRQLPWFAEFGPQQTRQFRALKLWMAMKHVGVEGYRELISRDILLAQALAEKICQHPDFELITAGPLSVTCFVYAPGGQGVAEERAAEIPAEIEALNRGLLEIVQRKGNVYLTSTQLQGRYVLRANIVNFRTEEADLDFLLEELAAAGREYLAGVGSGEWA